MLIVGIVGPYIGGHNRRLIDHNIANARYVGIRIANRFKDTKLVGFLIPHTHTAQFEVLAQAAETYYHELDDILYKKACDGFVLLPEWKDSSGARRDCERVTQYAKSVLFDLKSYEEHGVQRLLYALEQWAINLANTINYQYP